MVQEGKALRHDGGRPHRYCKNGEAQGKLHESFQGFTLSG